MLRGLFPKKDVFFMITDSLFQGDERNGEYEKI